MNQTVINCIKVFCIAMNRLRFELPPRSWTLAIPPIRRNFSTGIHRTEPFQSELADQTLNRTRGNSNAFSLHLLPKLTCTVDLPMCVPNALDNLDEYPVTLSANTLHLWVALASHLPPETRRGNLQDTAVRFDPKFVTAAVNQVTLRHACSVGQ